MKISFYHHYYIQINTLEFLAKMNSPRADSVNSYSTNSRTTYESTRERNEEDVDEQVAPELTYHSTAVVECIIEQIKHMESNIEAAKKGDFRIAIHKLEVLLKISSSV